MREFMKGALYVTAGAALVVGLEIYDEVNNRGYDVDVGQRSVAEAFSVGNPNATNGANPVVPSAQAPTLAPAPVKAPSRAAQPPKNLFRAPAATTAEKPTIVLDPGHSGSDNDVIDRTTKLRDHDYPTSPEIAEVFGVATQVKAALVHDGYKVIMTKKNVNDTVSLRDRANIALASDAYLAVSIHTDHSAGSDFQTVNEQFMGGYRGGSRGFPKTEFNDPRTAKLSKKFGDIICKERTVTLPAHPCSVVVNKSFSTRPELAPGNLALVQLFSQGTKGKPGVPWVYNEVGAKNGYNASAYARALTAGIEKAVPVVNSAR